MDVLLLEYKIKKNGYTIKDYCERLGINRTTYYRKTRGDSDFTRREIEATMDMLNLDSPCPIFFPKKEEVN